MFKHFASEAERYAEYGCGASTVWVMNNTSARVWSVDTSEQWADDVRAATGEDARLTMQWADLGSVGDWGRPVGYEKRENFGLYTDWLWDQRADFDLVLVDGRFRVCCFLTSLLRAKPGTRIVFDDYRDRTGYHVVEEIVRPRQVFGRQAIFVVPEQSDFDRDAACALMEQFRMVMD